MPVGRQSPLVSVAAAVKGWKENTKLVLDHNNASHLGVLDVERPQRSQGEL